MTSFRKLTPTRALQISTTLTTLKAAVRVIQHPDPQWQQGDDDFDLLPIRRIKPTQNVQCRICNPAFNDHIEGKDLILSLDKQGRCSKTRLQQGMVIVYYLFSDTLARKDETEPEIWDNETQQKIGLCNGAYFLLDGPIREGKEFDKYTEEFLYQNLHLCVYWHHRNQWHNLPGRTITIIHESYKSEFQRLYKKLPDLMLKNNSWLRLAKNSLDGQYVLHCKNVVVVEK